MTAAATKSNTSTKNIYIKRVPKGKEHPYFNLARGAAQNRDLSFEARGMLAYLLSKPDDWKLNPKDLEQNCSRSRVFTILEELREAGYIIYNKIREKGKIIEHRYDVYEEPYLDLPDMVLTTNGSDQMWISPEVVFADAYIIENQELHNTEGTEQAIPPTPVEPPDEMPELTETKTAPERGGEQGESKSPKSPSRRERKKSKKRKPEVRQELYEIVCLGSYGLTWQEVNATDSKGRANKITQLIHLRKPDITAAQLKAGYQYFAKKWPDLIKDPDRRMRDVDTILEYVGKAASEKASQPFKPHRIHGDDCPECKGGLGHDGMIFTEGIGAKHCEVCWVLTPEGIGNG